MRLRLAGLDQTRAWTVVAVANLTLFALMAQSQWIAYGGVDELAVGAGTRGQVLAQGALLAGTNLAYGTAVLGLAHLCRPLPRPWGSRLAILVGAALVASVPRMAVLTILDGTPGSLAFQLVEWVNGLAAGVIALAAALLVADLLTRAREHEQRAARAVAALQDEELRVRRQLADELHGTVQHRLVVAAATLARTAARATQTGRQDLAGELRHVCDDLDEIREIDVRRVSEALFPAGADIGTAQAIRIMLERLPPDITATLHLGPALQRLVDADEPPLAVADRLIVVYTVEEAVTNALKHGRATRIRLDADVRPTSRPGRWLMELTLDDDGRGLQQAPPRLRGLERHRARILARGGTLTLSRNPTGGTRLHVTLPFDRAQVE